LLLFLVVDDVCFVFFFLFFLGGRVKGRNAKNSRITTTVAAAAITRASAPNPGPENSELELDSF
jgi:hypothetical protein